MTGKVLVVEDDYVIRESLLEILRDSGFEAVGAAHGRAALDHLEGSPPLPCLIVLDLMMPVMDGRAFREEQLRRDTLAAIPVIVVSAHRDVAARAHDLHAIAYLNKPLNLKELLRIIREHCAA